MSVLVAILALGLGDPEALPRSLSESPSPAAAAVDHTGAWAVAPRLGYVLTPDADNNTWTAGVQLRHYAWELIALEASVDFHHDRYEGGDLRTALVPIELSGLIFPFKNWEIRPYGIAGVDLVFMTTRYSGSLSANSNSTRAYLGGHVGLGTEVDLSEKIWLDVDFRWIFMQEPAHFSGDSSDYLQFTVGINFKIG
jgi:outer membrane protein W